MKPLSLLASLASLFVFWGLSAFAGTRAAVAGTMVFVLADAAWRWRRKTGFPRLWRLTSVLTLGFGAIDLLAASPFLLAYEAVLTNLATALAFAVGARGTRPLLQELAEQSGRRFPDRPDITVFFRLLTLAWAVAYAAKAVLYFWAACTLPPLQAMALRSGVGPVSLIVLLGISLTQGRRLFMLCRRLGMLPAPEKNGEAPLTTPRPVAPPVARC